MLATNALCPALLPADCCRLETLFYLPENEMLVFELWYFEKVLIAFLFHLQDWSPQFLVYGDMGRVGGAPSLQRLISEARSGHNTAVLHVGDFAYDLNTQGGLVSKFTVVFRDQEFNTERKTPILSCEIVAIY